jgi:hypothetical protein
MVINNHFYPTIKCPWCCTEYHIHCCGKVPYDILLLCILSDDIRCYSDLKKRRCVACIRNDFIDQHEWQETFVWNPTWPVIPSVAFSFNEENDITDLSYLTCRNHDDGGTPAIFFHAPRAICNTLPSPHGNQVAPAVVVPRILKPAQHQERNHSLNTHF